MNIPPDEQFYTSSYSSQGGECVEIALTDSRSFVRDTKNREGLCLSLPPEEMVALLRTAPSA